MFIIDTNVLIWALVEKQKLGKRARSLLEDEIGVQCSVISLYEIAIKERLGRFKLLDTAIQEMKTRDIDVMPLTASQLRVYAGLKEVQLRDPFDLGIMALAIDKGQPLMTSDIAILEANLPELKVINART